MNILQQSFADFVVAAVKVIVFVAGYLIAVHGFGVPDVPAAAAAAVYAVSGGCSNAR